MARSGSAVLGEKIPATPAGNAFAFNRGAGGVGPGRTCVVVKPVPIRAPLKDVAMHVVQTPGIWFLLADSVRPLLAIVECPGILPKEGFVVAKAEYCLGSGPTGVFPFRFRREANRHAALL